MSPFGGEREVDRYMKRDKVSIVATVGFKYPHVAK